MNESFEKYWQLVDDVQAEVVRLSEMYSARLHCAPGCTDCCRAFSVFPIEAAILTKALSPLGKNESRIGAGSTDVCLLLHNSRCRVYAARPLLCRTQGLPIGYVDHEHGQIEVSACPVNFADESYEVEHLLMMDDFNNRLQRINLGFCRKRRCDPWQRIAIGEIVTNLSADSTLNA